MKYYGDLDCWGGKNMVSKIPSFFRPSAFFLLLSMILLLIYIVIPPQNYESLFWSSKVVSLQGLIFIIAIVLVTAIFAYIGEKVIFPNQVSYRLLTKSKKYEEISLPRWWIISAMLSCIIAYLIWFSIGILRAGGVTGLYYAYLSNAFYVKQVLLYPIPGITSFTQIGVIIAPMSLINKKISLLEKYLIVIILILALVRSFIFSERLALLEMIIPIMIVYASRKQLDVKKLARGFIVFAICVIAFFIFNESRRSFSARGISTLYDIVSNGVFRFFGYYLTSINNYGLSFNNYEFKFPFFFTLSSLWNLPGLGWLYKDFFPAESFDAPQLLLVNQLNPELNVFTTVGYWVMEYGLAFSLIFAAFYGLFSGIAFKMAKYSSYWLAFYSVWFIGILEFMRIYYIGSPRVFIPFAFFIVTMILRKSLSRGGKNYEDVC